VIDPARADQLERLLRKHRITLKHRLGQNFLIDPSLRDAIADAGAGNEVLEVGAGVGTLTIALASRSRRVVAVEFDRDLIPALREVVGGLENVDVVQADILHYDATAEIVTGNIPYGLTGALIPKLFDRPSRPKRVALVVQKEVAERWTATTTASLGTVAVQVFAVPRIGMTIPAPAFTPPPKVDSALVVMQVREQPLVNVPDMDRFFRFVEAAFQFRRKQLGGTVARIAGISSVDASMRLREIGIEAAARPQTLTIPQWEAAFRAFIPLHDR